MKALVKAVGSCTIDGCGKREFARGWCQKHYTRWLRHGDPVFSLKRMDMSPIERFFQHVEITETCWLWRGPVNVVNGYGVFRSEGSPHRFSHELFIGPIPEGWQVDHLCHTNDPSCPGGRCPHRVCVNPDHLEAVTPTENTRRSTSRITHCPHGHEYTPENTRKRPGHGRECRTCVRDQGRRAKEKRRALA